MLTRQGAIVLCTKQAVTETAAFMGGLYQAYDGHATRYEDSQTGGGAVRMTWRNGICWISRHSGYQNDRTEEAFEVLTVLFDAVEFKGERNVAFHEFIDPYNRRTTFEIKGNQIVESHTW